MRAASLLVAVSVVCLMGCEEESAEDQCNDFVDAVCEKVAECTKGEGDTELNIESRCLKALKPSCQEADEKNDNIDECIDAIEDTQCDDFLEGVGDDEFEPSLPNQCNAD